jgi:hypothetical protein
MHFSKAIVLLPALVAAAPIFEGAGNAPPILLARGLDEDLAK